MSLIHVDVSEHQTSAFDDTYNRPFGMFRAASEWDRPDAKAPANLAWCVNARKAGKLVNFGVYVIPGNVPNDAVLGRLALLGVPDDCVVMIDAESWGGLVTGDHSAQFNSLAIALKTRQSGRGDLVWGYLNPNVDAALWPTRPSWLGFIQPAYGPSSPPDPKGLNRVGWQYCNAVQNGTTYPSSTSPFGRCDHNVMFIDYPTPLGADMQVDLTPDALYQVRQQVIAALADPTHSYLQDEFAKSNAAVIAGVKAEIADLRADVLAALQALPPVAGSAPVTGAVSGSITITPQATP